MHEPKRRRVDGKTITEPDRLVEPRAPEPAINGNVALRQNPQRDLRAIAVKSASEKTAVRPNDAHHSAGIGLTIGDIGAVHPEMAVSDSFFAAWSDGDGVFHCGV